MKYGVDNGETTILVQEKLRHMYRTADVIFQIFLFKGFSKNMFLKSTICFATCITVWVFIANALFNVVLKVNIMNILVFSQLVTYAIHVSFH